MEATNETILDLQKKAESLLKNINEIGKRADLLQISITTLDEVRTSLSELITETKNLTTESHGIIDKLNEIGSAKILEELTSMNDMLTAIDENINKNNKEIGKNIGQLKQDLGKLINDARSEQASKLKWISFYIWGGLILILAVQVVSIVIK